MFLLRSMALFVLLGVWPCLGFGQAALAQEFPTPSVSTASQYQNKLPSSGTVRQFAVDAVSAILPETLGVVVSAAQVGWSAFVQGASGRPFWQSVVRVSAEYVVPAGFAAIGAGLCALPCSAVGAAAGGHLVRSYFQQSDQIEATLAQADAVLKEAQENSAVSVYPPQPVISRPIALSLATRASAAIIGGSASHIGQPGTVVMSSQVEVRPQGLSNQTAGFESGPYRVTVGDQSKHLGMVGSYGSITLPNGAAVAINNADVEQVVAVKEFRVGGAGGVFTFQTLANFVTNEFPDFVGSQFNDTATITIKTQAGQSATFSAKQLFSDSVNGSSFTPASGLPSPLSSDGGHTGFREVLKRVNVAPGSKVTVEFRVQNVGDTAVPSALLLSAPRK